MRIIASAFAVIVLVACVSAHEKDIVTYQANGAAHDGITAYVRNTNPRIDALDLAFANAVSQALRELLDADTRQQNKDVLDHQILFHSRLWVTKFIVIREIVVDGRKLITASVFVDRDKLRARLAELGIDARQAHD